ncbi:hypothetical protein QN399_15160 [Pseudomonas sp. 10C3]|uniref:hypothetical protein n=1 Tax=Pseudomonas sp. 10C3 TaxID=3118753 RepID=UPI002E807578|nr:hypothetical protein [Pseudomonas sp. 10C3]MEE3507586.1 hypothetical protein [Pseudomonas sp. 10C3]
MSFHPQKNLLRGRNHTGKTSLIRSIFETLGAKPQGKLESWDENTASLLEFSVGGCHFFALHQNGRRALFNANQEMIIATSKFGEWSQAFCNVTDFNLVFTDKKESAIQPADPACFFLPFYVNQDGSWQSEWNTFSGLKRFNSPWSAILEYFTGVCPPEYYRARAERVQESKALEEHRREYKLLERTIERFSRTLPLSGPKLNPENFANEIALLTQGVTELNQQQELLRSAAVREQDLLSSLEQQIRLADDALAAYGHDAKYLRTGDSEPLICPTCNAEHTKSFLDLLHFAEDARVLRELAGRLRDDATEVRHRCGKALARLSTLNENYQRISSVLDTRKGELKFQDVVESMGAESAFAAFEVERKLLQEAIDKALGVVNALDEKMKRLRAPKRTRAILEDFRSYYVSGRVALKLHPVDASKMKLTGRPDLSGSGGPRSILAYYAALWRTCQGVTGTFDVPVVIDSPNQQAQDDVNLPAVLQFIAKELPDDMQLIVGLETETDFPFDKEIHLDVPYSMLLEDHWAEAECIIEPLLEKMYATMKSDV